MIVSEDDLLAVLAVLDEAERHAQLIELLDRLEKFREALAQAEAEADAEEPEKVANHGDAEQNEQNETPKDDTPGSEEEESGRREENEREEEGDRSSLVLTLLALGGHPLLPAPASIIVLRHATALPDAHASARERFKAQRMLAEAHASSGDHASAVPCFRASLASLDAWRQAPSAPEQLTAMILKASVIEALAESLLAHDPAGAADHFAEAEREWSAVSPDTCFAAGAKAAEALALAGRPADALAKCQQLLGARRDLEMSEESSLATVLAAMTCAYLALDAYQKAAEVAGDLVPLRRLVADEAGADPYDDEEVDRACLLLASAMLGLGDKASVESALELASAATGTDDPFGNDPADDDPSGNDHGHGFRSLHGSIVLVHALAANDNGDKAEEIAAKLEALLKRGAAEDKRIAKDAVMAMAAVAQDFARAAEGQAASGAEGAQQALQRVGKGMDWADKAKNLLSNAKTVAAVVALKRVEKKLSAH